MNELNLSDSWLKKSLLYIPLVTWAIITVIPFLYMLVLATKGRAEIFQFPPPILFNSTAIEGASVNYTNLLNETRFWSNFFISIYISGLATVFSLFFCSLAGYSFAVYEFKGKEALFRFMIITMMIPAVVSIVPYFAEMKYFDWLNLPRALYLPIVANAYGVFLMRQFIQASISKAVVEAARIDGATEFKIYWMIALPMLKPALGTLGIITFLSSWNDFMRSLVIMTEKQNYTVPVALNMMKGMQTVDYGAIMIGATISTMPIILIFIFLSKWIISRLTDGAIKG